MLIIVEHANLEDQINVFLAIKDINWRPQIRALLYVLKINVSLQIVPYVTLLETLAINVWITIMFGMQLLRHVYLINVISKTVKNVKPIQQNANNVRAKQFYLFQAEAVCSLQYKIVRHSEWQIILCSVGTVLVGIKLIIQIGQHVREFVQTQTVLTVQIMPVFVKHV